MRYRERERERERGREEETRRDETRDERVEVKQARFVVLAQPSSGRHEGAAAPLVGWWVVLSRLGLARLTSAQTRITFQSQRSNQLACGRRISRPQGRPSPGPLIEIELLLQQATELFHPHNNRARSWGEKKKKCLSDNSHSHSSFPSSFSLGNWIQYHPSPTRPLLLSLLYSSTLRDLSGRWPNCTASPS
jgi:hypothetical protein